MEWTSKEVQFLEVNRGRLTYKQMADRLGRELGQVGDALRRLSRRRRLQGNPLRPLRKSTEQLIDEYGDRVKRLWEKDWSDPDIAKSLGLPYRTAYLIRRRLGLPGKRYTERRRRKLSNLVKEHHNLWVANCLKAEAMGWPDHSLGEARVLDTLFLKGPCTADQLADYMGLAWHRNGNKTLYRTLGRLAARGEVVRSGGRRGGAPGQPPGSAPSSYRLADGVGREAMRQDVDDEDDDRPRGKARVEL